MLKLYSFRYRIFILSLLVGGAFLCAKQSLAQVASLDLGQSLNPNQFLIPEAGDRPGCAFKGLMQSNGRFILSNAGVATYSKPSSSSSVANSKLILQNNGNLQIVTAANVVKWSSNTTGKGGVKLLVRNDGNLVLVNQLNGIVWQTSTAKADCNIGPAGAQGPQGIQGIQGVAGARAIALTRTLAPGALPSNGGESCSTGGVEIETFTDVGADGTYSGDIDNPHSIRVICNGVAGAAGTSSAVVKTPIVPGAESICPAGGVEIAVTMNGVIQGVPTQICNGIKGDTGATGAKGDTGATGAKGDTGATGARAVADFLALPAGDNDLCPSGGKLLRTWTDVVQDQVDGRPVFSVGDLNLREEAICNGLAGAKGDTGATGAKGDTGATGAKGDTGAAGAKGDTGAGVVIIKSDADGGQCANGGFKLSAYRDLNNNGVVNVEDPLMFDSITTCNGLKGADGFTSIIGTSMLASGSSLCPTGGVQFDICLDTDRSGSCNAGDGSRSQPHVCNGANSVVTMNQNSDICNGRGGVEFSSFTDINNTGRYEENIDKNWQASFVCNGAQGNVGEQGAAGVNDVVVFTNAIDQSGQCAAGLVRATTFADLNGNGLMEDPETIKRSFDFCSGDTTVARTTMMSQISSLITGQVDTLRSELMVQINSISQQVEILLGSQNIITNDISRLQNDVRAMQATITSLSTQAVNLETVVSNLANQVSTMSNSINGLQVQINENHNALLFKFYELQATVAALQASITGTQSLVSRQINNAETELCPLGSGGMEVSLCTLAEGVCDQSKAISKVNVCNPAWQGITISGEARGFRSGELVLENNGVSQIINVQKDGTKPIPFKFLVLPNQAYDIRVTSNSGNELCEVINGKGIAGNPFSSSNPSASNISGLVAQCFGQWSTGLLSAARYHMAATSVGTKALFAGGYQETFANSVDIYDTSTHTWSTAQLSVGREALAGISVGTKAFFAGGNSNIGLSKVVDIYDSATNTWSTAELSQARYNLAAAAVGTKVFFAGGFASSGRSSRVDIFDSSTNTWSTASLSQARYNLTATSTGTKVFFAGGDGDTGISNVVDIYDSATNTWSTSVLPSPRYNLSAAGSGAKVIFAGGIDATGYLNVVDIYDTTTNTWSTSKLSVARGELTATTVGNKVFFAGGISLNGMSNVVDVFDFATNTASISTLSEARYALVATSVGNKAFFAGGYGGNGFSKIVDILTEE